MTMTPLNEEDELILDTLLNLGKTTRMEIEEFEYGGNEHINTKALQSSLERLQGSNLITAQKDPYESFVINPEARSSVEQLITKSMEQKKVMKQSLSDLPDPDYQNIPKLLAAVSTLQNRKSVSVSGYAIDPAISSLCSKLYLLGMGFRHRWSSRKNYYDVYHFRTFPFDALNELEQLVLNKLNLHALDNIQEWIILALTLYSDAPLTIKGLNMGMPEFNPAEIRESLYNLERTGVITVKDEKLEIISGVKELVQNYFSVNLSQRFKDFMLERIKRRTKELTSNLYFIGLVKRLLVNHSPSNSTQPFVAINRTYTLGISEEDLAQAAKLGLVLLSESEVLVAVEVLNELDSIFKTSLDDKSFIVVHARNMIEANIAWKRVFSDCESYVKVQDEYVNEDTFEVLDIHLPREVDVIILSSIKGPTNLSVEDMKGQIDRLKSRGHKVDVRFVGYSKTGEAPFHQRYVLSKDSCFLISQSMKEIGKTKDASIVELARDKKVGEVEPAFEYWFNESEEKLRAKGIQRWNYGEWLNRKLSGAP